MSVLKRRNDEKVGELAAIGHLVLDGFWPVGAAYGTQILGIPPVQLLGLATFLSFFFFLPLTLWMGGAKQLLNRKVFMGSLAYTACLLLPYAAIFYASQSNSAINVALLTQSEVIFAAIIGWLFLKEKIQTYRILGIFFITIANILVLYNGDLQINPASLILVFAPVVFVFGNAIAKRLQADGLGYAPLLLFRSGVGGALLLLFSTMIEDIQIPSSDSWIFLIAFGLIAFGIPKVLWQIALNKIDLSKTTAIGLSYPAFSFILAYFMLKEIPTIYQWLGLSSSFLGIYFLMRSSSKPLVDLAQPTD